MTIQEDKALIEQLGAPSKVAKLLQFSQFGVQRVQNWTVRGIPYKVKVEHPAIFMPGLAKSLATNTPQATEPTAQ